MLKTIFALLLMIFTGNIFAQEAYDWRIYSNKKNLSAIHFDGVSIWAGSDGGAYRFTLQDSSFTEFTKAAGLNGSAVTAIIIDNQNKVWFGSKNGIIDVYEQETGTFKRIMAISNSGKPQKGINNFVLYGDTVVVSTDFGVSLINSKTLNFYDSFIKFGNIAANTKVNSVYRDSRFYVATQGGLAVQKVGTTNLNDPEAWDVYQSIPSVGTVSFQLVTADNGIYLAGTNKGLYSFSNGVFTLFSADLNNKTIKKFAKAGSNSYFLSDYSIPGGSRSSIDVFNGTTKIKSVTDLPTTVDLIPELNSFLYAASTEGLLKINDVGITGAIQPNAPSANIFSGITVDLNGNLYSASGRDVSGKGFYKYDGNSWTNYDVVSTPLLPTNAYYNASTTPDGSVYLGSYGRGLLRIKPDGSLIPYTTQNTPLVGISTDPSFLVVAAVKSDSKGNLWILNFDAGNRKTLNMLTTDSTWYGFENSFGIGLTNYSTLEIDQNDVKWFTTPLRNSLFYYSEKGTPANTADDISGQLNESNGMNGQKINALALDKRGDLWVGTDLGVQIITSLSTVLQNSSTAKPRVSTVFSLRQQRINSIVVDPVNRKWVGTDAGLFLVSSDGTSLIAFYDVTNSPLLANEITIMGSDPKDGKIFIGQTGGLISFKTQAPSPNTDYSNLYTYPSPFRPSNGSMMTIDGLIKESDIIILDIAGNKVKSFSSPGGRVANWDGRDDNGNVVSTGVYILVASDKEGNTVSKIKFSVVR
ncbi:MAG: hypothetical protein IPG53_14380 [Ignavibacteriales bacterium]|nr:hypothetical protein [Ignavibacteriales bacterium]